VTKDEQGRVRLMRQKIDHDPDTAFRVLKVIWDRQSEGEKFTHQYDPREGGKGEGFTPHDTPAANALYERFKDAGERWQNMSAIDVVRCQRMMQKYAKQYLAAGADKRDRGIQSFKVRRGSYGEQFKATTDEERQRMVSNIERWADKRGV
jgi:hypothetical protein